MFLRTSLKLFAFLILSEIFYDFFTQILNGASGLK